MWDLNYDGGTAITRIGRPHSSAKSWGCFRKGADTPTPLPTMLFRN